MKCKKLVVVGFMTCSHSQAASAQVVRAEVQADAAKLRETSRGDVAAIKSQLDIVARTCKSCHDDFKKS